MPSISWHTRQCGRQRRRKRGAKEDSVSRGLQLGIGKKPQEVDHRIPQQKGVNELSTGTTERKDRRLLPFPRMGARYWPPNDVLFGAGLRDFKRQAECGPAFDAIHQNADLTVAIPKQNAGRGGSAKPFVAIHQTGLG